MIFCLSGKRYGKTLRTRTCLFKKQGLIVFLRTWCFFLHSESGSFLKVTYDYDDHKASDAFRGGMAAL